MTTDEFLSAIKSRGAILAPAPQPNQVALANVALQQRRCAMLPQFITEIYSRTGGINMGNGYIFGPTDVAYNARFPAPSITQINDEIANNPKMVGKTVFGRNDLFWFAFDAFGTCFMLDNLTLSPLRKYDDPYKALTDCLIAGKI